MKSENGKGATPVPNIYYAKSSVMSLKMTQMIFEIFLKSSMLLTSWLRTTVVPWQLSGNKKYMSIMQQEHETCTAFMKRLRNMRVIYENNSGQKINQATAVGQAINKLHHKHSAHKCSLRAQPPKTLNKLRAYLASADVDGQLGASEAQFDNGTVNKNPMMFHQSTNEVKFDCMRCYRNGHSAIECNTNRSAISDNADNNYRVVNYNQYKQYNNKNKKNKKQYSGEYNRNHKNRGGGRGKNKNRNKESNSNYSSRNSKSSSSWNFAFVTEKILSSDSDSDHNSLLESPKRLNITMSNDKHMSDTENSDEFTVYLGDSCEDSELSECDFSDMSLSDKEELIQSSDEDFNLYEDITGEEITKSTSITESSDNESLLLPYEDNTNKKITTPEQGVIIKEITPKPGVVIEHPKNTKNNSNPWDQERWRRIQEAVNNNSKGWNVSLPHISDWETLKGTYEETKALYNDRVIKTPIRLLKGKEKCNVEVNIENPEVLTQNETMHMNIKIHESLNNAYEQISEKKWTHLIQEDNTVKGAWEITDSDFINEPVDIAVINKEATEKEEIPSQIAPPTNKK